MSISKFIKRFKFAKSANSLSNADRRVQADMGLAAPYATLLSMHFTFDMGNGRI
ncbi:MAG: hypothetical protein HON65_02400 [Rhodospirillales bacterium]|jgi:hypothetical protein|nr:hypothetical protein [Rhodospirillales bacterium]